MDGPRSRHFDRDVSGTPIFYLWPTGDTAYVVTRSESAVALGLLVRRYYQILTVVLMGSAALMRLHSDFSWLGLISIPLVVGWYRASARRIVAGLPRVVSKRPVANQSGSLRSMIGATRPWILRLGVAFFAALSVLFGVLMLLTEHTLDQRLRAAKAVGATALFALMFYWMLRSKRS